MPKTQQCAPCIHFIPNDDDSEGGTCYEGGYTEIGDATDERTRDDEMWCNAHKLTLPRLRIISH